MRLGLQEGSSVVVGVSVVGLSVGVSVGALDGAREATGPDVGAQVGSIAIGRGALVVGGTDCTSLHGAGVSGSGCRVGKSVGV